MITVKVLYSISGVGTQILLSHKSDDLLVDSGDGTLRDLIKLKYSFNRLRGILITHEHFDHICGLYALLNFMRLLGRKRKLSIVVPKSIRHVHLLLNPPLMYRSLTYPIEIKEVTDKDRFRLGEINISTFSVEHEKEFPSLGYSIHDPEGLKVVVSGDTRPCENLEREVEGADVAVLECTLGKKRKTITIGHMTRSEAEELGRKARKLILIHRKMNYRK
ncbi:MAG: MBL fold metallo-hydrolase [Candidatus Bathyarchaeota archaeon]|nr:MBL fold metallo-hydrolase [Candidatus Bathyarchaeota archaeon]